MVYNAMKLFMEVNPQLFDECSHDYTEQQNNAEAVKQNRQAKWDRLSQLADSMRANVNGGAHNTAVSRPPEAYGGGRNGANAGVGTNLAQHIRPDGSGAISPGSDGMAQDSQRRLEQLRLQDDRERTGSRSGPNKDYNSVR